MNKTTAPLRKIFSVGICIGLFLFSSAIATSQSNYAVNYDGSNDYISLPASVAVSQLNTFTVEAWVYWNGTNNGCIYSETIQGNNNPMFSIIPRSTDGGGIELTFRDNSATGLILQPATATITANRWVHVAVVRTSATTMKIYIDGILKDNVTFTAPASWTPDKVNIGLRWRAAQTDLFAGKIDELRIWNTARTQAEIKANMFNKNLANNAGGLVAYYRFNEGSGTTAANSCTNTSSIDGTLTNGPTWAGSPIQFGANALNFDGTDDYVDIPHNSTLDITTAITLEAWVYAVKNTGIQDVISKSTSAVNTGYIFPRTDDGWAHAVVYLHISSGWRTLSAVYPSLNAWHHLAATYDGTTIKLYIDGVLANSASQSGSITSNSNALALGNQPGFPENFGGSADEFRIWNVARTQAEIQADMNNELDPSAQTGLVSYYTANQGIAAGTNTGLITLVDQESTNNGTLTNFALTGSSSNFVSQNNNLVVLPLQWLSFTVQPQGSEALLRWSTASEQNTKDFIIQRSSDGVTWNSIGSMVAAGNSSTVSNFSYTDAQPGTGTIYYRILQRDNDGRYSYSNVVSVSFHSPQLAFTVVSNPVTNGQLQLKVYRTTVINLYNAGGSLLLKQQLTGGTTTIDLSRYAKGVYWLQEGNYIQKILLQ